MHKGVVLVVDDEAPIRDILSFYLKRAGYQVLLAENGRMALEEMAKLQPDLILSDLRMPEMAGDELCQAVKGDPRTRDIFFVLVSAMDGLASKIGGLNLGADDMISKPFHAQEVMAKVESAFRIIAMQKEIKRQNLELTRFQDRMTAELALAARLQMGLLPGIPGLVSGLRYTHRYLPAEGIGGDIYTIQALPDQQRRLHDRRCERARGDRRAHLGHGQDLLRKPAALRARAPGLGPGHEPGPGPQHPLRTVRHRLPGPAGPGGRHHAVRLGRPSGAPAHPPGRRAAAASAWTSWAARGSCWASTRPCRSPSRSARSGRATGWCSTPTAWWRWSGRTGATWAKRAWWRSARDLPADGEAAADRIIEQAVAFNQPAAFSDDVTLVVLDGQEAATA